MEPEPVLYFLCVGLGKSYGFWGGGESLVEAKNNLKSAGARKNCEMLTHIFMLKSIEYGAKPPEKPYVSKDGSVCWTNEWKRIHYS